MPAWIIALLVASYLGLLFVIAYYGDKRADAGRSLIANPYVYALSLGVYTTAWTFYGSVGRAAALAMGTPSSVARRPALAAVRLGFVRYAWISACRRVSPWAALAMVSGNMATIHFATRLFICRLHCPGTRANEVR